MPEKSYGIFSPVLGIKQDMPSILLKEGYMPEEQPDYKDCFFNNGAIESVKKRLKAWATQLEDPILHGRQVRDTDGTYFTVLCTKRDIVYRDESNSRHKYLTPRYNTGKIRVENGSDKIYGGLEIDNCDDGTIQWVDGSGGDVTPSRETTSPQEGTSFVRLTVGAGAGVEILAYHDLAAPLDITAHDSVGFWIRSSVNTSAGDLTFAIDESTGVASPDEDIDIPALTANTWTWINLALSDPSILNAVASIGIKQAVDLGACTIDIDQVVAGDWAGQLNAGDFITIGTSYTTDDTWYEVSSVDSDTEITLTVVYAGSSESQKAYQARQTYSGTNLDPWRSIYFNGSWIGTNNAKDNIQAWDLSTGSLAADLGGSPDKARFIEEFENLVLIADLTDSGGDRFPTTYKWCDLADETNWSTGSSGESLIPGSAFIMGIAEGEIDGFKVIATKRAFYRLHAVSGDEVFQRETITKDIGLAAGDSMVNYDRSIFCFASDSTFRRVTTTSWDIISKGIDEITRTILASYSEYIKGTYNDEFKQILWLIPNATANNQLNQILTLDLDDKFAWGTISVTGTCFASVTSAESVTWDTLPFSTWETWDWDEWDRLVNLSNFQSSLIPDYNGDAFYLFQSEQDNGVDYERSFVLGSDLQGQRGLGTFKRLLRAHAFFDSEDDGTINMQIKGDRQKSWQDHQESSAKTLVRSTHDFTVLEFYFDSDLSRHFMFRFFAENRFRFLGMIAWFDDDYGSEFT